MAIDFRLYLITDRKMIKMPLTDAVRLALEGGVRAVQLREKDLPIRDLVSLSAEIRAVTNEFGAKLFINDRVDVAMAVDADGVHLGNQSMPPHAVRKIAGDDFLIGVSTHSLEEAWEAETGGADFITFGPIFPTPSKSVYGPPVGIDALNAVVRKVSIPVFGLGGIKNSNIRQVLSAGAHGIALISGILAFDDIRGAAEQVESTIKRILAGERPEQ